MGTLQSKDSWKSDAGPSASLETYPPPPYQLPPSLTAPSRPPTPQRARARLFCLYPSQMTFTRQKDSTQQPQGRPVGPWTEADIVEAAKHLPRPEKGGATMAKALTDFFRDYVPTSSEMARIMMKICSPTQFAAVKSIFSGHWQPATINWASSGADDDPHDIAYRDFTTRLITKAKDEGPRDYVQRLMIVFDDHSGMTKPDPYPGQEVTPYETPETTIPSRPPTPTESAAGKKDRYGRRGQAYKESPAAETTGSPQVSSTDGARRHNGGGPPSAPSRGPPHHDSNHHTRGRKTQTPASTVVGMDTGHETASGGEEEGVAEGTRRAEDGDTQSTNSIQNHGNNWTD
ncbi:hypothetical protein D4764_14G0004360 [Takifugu flavidus]|uniref:Uncharacterized protein n=1 Tax=Takifugu flavidus TaxID=433684 RepID=A0A5C6P4A1_9TELE|nr:hypothetical protein D4764_14G0004360 [Takifugu flavidus]